LANGRAFWQWLEEKNPYKVVRLQYSDFYDLKALVAATVANKSVDVDGQQVTWRKVRSLRFRSNNVGYRYSLQDDYKHIDLSIRKPSKTARQKVASSRRGRRHQKSAGDPSPLTGNVPVLRPKFTTQIPISQAKKRDLLDLCRNKVIDKDCHPWYEALPVSSRIEDKLPLPDINEEICNED